MSFFRFLIALLISAGIAYGLYLAVDERRFDRAVEAVRTEIANRTGGTVEEEAPEAGEAGGVESAELAAPDERAPAAAAAEEDAPVIDADGTETAPGDDEQVAPEDAGADDGTEIPASGFAARIEGTVAEAEAQDTEEPAAPAAEVEVEVETASQDDAEPATGENDLPRIAAMPAPPETVLPDDAQAPAALETGETQDALPAVRIADATGTSTAALDAVNGGMSYAEARKTMIEAGWTPRLPAIRTGEPNEAESAMIEAGYGELEGCNEAERPICRFEFVDGEKRIAAVLTAGTGIDPSVIDAFLMTIRAE